MKYYKIVDPSGHNGLKYHEGLNVDPLPFNPSGSCEPGGIYFAKEDILAFLDFGTELYEVDPVGPVYENPGRPKIYKAHAVNLKYIGPVRDNIEYLIKEGADVHADGESALFYAIFNNDLKLVDLLIKHGADVNVKESLPLFCAIESNNLELADLLINHGADVNGDNGLFLIYAFEDKNLKLFKYLISRGADLTLAIDAARDSIKRELLAYCNQF